MLASNAHAGDVPSKPSLLGTEYLVVGTLYVYEVTKNLNKRTVDFVELVPLRMSGPEILSQRVVPLGSRLRIVSRAPKRWYSFLMGDRYLVELDSIQPPTGVTIHLEIARGNQGATTPLNPAIFEPVLPKQQ